MECIFLSAAGTTLFVRNDIESGHWVVQEMSVNADFPYNPDQTIERGMRIAFRDPATDVLQVFEIRNVVNSAQDAYQQITAEHICIAELQDEHIDSSELTNITAAQALTRALAGTTWKVGTSSVSALSSGDIGRGSVWNAVTMIKNNWNVYITPRVEISASGQITNKYLDITSAQGVWNGLRLGIRKNIVDPAVTYDDEETLTALYGYGGNIDVPSPGGAEDTQQELTFAGVTWSKTAEHPAKPAGQTYLEWPEKTTLYGRAGRPRFGYYQNSSITDAQTLLAKTWEALKRTAQPKINITGTVTDLYRLGYTDQPLTLHSQVIVDVLDTMETFYLQIIMLDVDLVDPTGNRVEIGDYIPNIVYIARNTNEVANGTDSTSGSQYSTSSGSGGSGGGGGNRGQSNNVYTDGRHYTEWIKTADKIGMVVGQWNGGYKIKAGEITLAINDADESIANIDANHVNISATDDFYALAGDIEHDAQGRLILKSAGGIYVEKNESGVTSYYGVWDRGNLTGGVVVDLVNGQTTTYISGDKINIGSGGQIQTIAGTMVADAAGNLTILNGSGFRLNRGGAEYGVWDEGNLTGGVIVQKVNGQTETKITGNSIDIGSVINIINSGGQSIAKISADHVDINGSSVKISADRLNIDGIVTALATKSLGVGSLTVEGQTTTQNIYSEGNIVAENIVRANGGLNVAGTATDVHSLKIDNVEQAKFLGTADVNFDKAGAIKEGMAKMGLTVSGNTIKVVEGTVKSIPVTMQLALLYDSANHRYASAASAYAAGSVLLVNQAKNSGTEAYDAGYTAGQTAGYNEGYTAGRAAGYNEGYSAGVLYVYNNVYVSGNTIIGPNSSGSGQMTWYTITAGVDGTWGAGGAFEAYGYAYINGQYAAYAHRTFS